jgi:aminoglycoside/choline kinase family phosphotransferase
MATNMEGILLAVMMMVPAVQAGDTDAGPAALERVEGQDTSLESASNPASRSRQPGCKIQ